MMLLFYFSCLILVIYCIFIGWVTFNIQTDFKRKAQVSLNVSIIIPCRNEAENIGKCLRSIALQTLPSTQFEVIVVDDFSDDNTVKIANEFKNKLPLTVLHNAIAGKKSAITMGVAYAGNDIVVTTDADCTMEPEWLNSLLYDFNSRQLNMLCGPINFNDSDSFFQQLQQTESAAIVGISSVMLNKKKPATCNGASLMFSKTVFNLIGGYRSHSHVATGDDDLLMHGFYQYDAAKVAYNLNSSSVVYTKASEDLGSFVQQRIRWLSKRGYYIYKWNNYLQMLVLLQLFAFYYILFFGFISGSFIASTLLLNKFIFDLIFGIKLRNVFHFKYWSILLMPVFELYIVLVLIYGRVSKKKWKDRSL